MKLFLVSLFLLLVNIVQANVVINEVMFNPAGNEYHDEFVEIYNNSDQPVDLSGWKVGDQDEVDGLLAYPVAGSGLILQPNSYAIILDSSYPQNSQLYSSLIPDSVLKLIIDDGSFGSSGFSNSVSETVFLVANTGLAVDSVKYLIDQIDGISDERFSFITTTWLNSNVINGTPGKKNSVVPLDYDLALKMSQIVQSNSSQIFAKVKNCGVKTINSFHLEIQSNGLILQQFDNGMIVAGDSVIYNVNLSTGNGSFTLTGKLECENDQNLINNLDTLQCFNSLAVNSVRLNEFMKKPSTGNCEWVEIYNATTDTISSPDLAFRDKTSSLLKLGSNKKISPNDYLVIAKDSTIAISFNIPQTKLLILKTLPALSDEDALFICDKSGLVLDSLIYQNSWSEDYDYSIEKKSPLLNSANTANWAKSVSGATPGFKNSVMPKDYDLSIEMSAVLGSRVAQISAKVKNCGLKPVNNFHLEIKLDQIIVQQFDNGIIAAGDSLGYNFSAPATSGSIVLVSKLIAENDQNLINNVDTLQCFNSLAVNSVRLNEFMKKPSSGNCEWVEIYNATADTISSLDLAFRDKASSLLKLGSYKKISPNDYLVIARDSTIAISFNTPQTKLLILKTLPALSDEDALFICDKSGKVLDSLIYKNNWADEYDNSIEKISPLLNSNSTANWKPSISGATPGFKNSVMPKDYDLSIKMNAVLRSRVAQISVKVKNCGLKLLNSFHLEIKLDQTIIQQFDNGTIAAGDSLVFNFSAPVTSGSLVLVGKLECENDQNLVNNVDTLQCFNSLAFNSVRLNEFMKKPSSGNCEWVEIYNATADTISSLDLAFKDNTSSLLKLGSNKKISPNDYLVIARDSSVVEKFQILMGKLLILKTLPTLSDEDALFLCDQQGSVLDSLIFDNNWSEEYDNSIEKINPLLASSDPANWVPSVQNATPGTKNSVYQEIGAINGINNVCLSAQLVSPNEDGKNDQLLVNYSFASPFIYLTAEVYNLKGHSVCKILDKSYKPAESSFAWDCRDKGGNMSAMGAYILFIETKDNSGVERQFKKVFYIVK